MAELTFNMQMKRPDLFSWIAMLLSYPHTVHMEAHLFFSKVVPVLFLLGRSRITRVWAYSSQESCLRMALVEHMNFDYIYFSKMTHCKQSP